MKRTSAIMLMLLITLTLGACTCFRAMKGPFDNGAINSAFVETIVDKAETRLDLTPAQRTEFRTIVEKMLSTALAQRQESMELRQRLADELRSAQLNKGEVDRLLKRKMELMRAVLDSGSADLVALHATLSQQQRDKLAELMLEHGQSGWHGAHGW